MIFKDYELYGSLDENSGLPYLLGGKTYGLLRIKDAVEKSGARIPPWFCVTTDSDFLNNHSLLKDVESHWHEHLRSAPVAVRSSSVDEDQQESSAAGRYDSTLNVKTVDAITKAVKACINSSRGERATTMRVNTDAQPMGVLIQKQVHSLVSGVSATCDLTTSMPCVLTSATEGLGDKLVDGTSDATHWRGDIDGNSIIGPSTLLTLKQHRTLATLAKNLEAVFNGPCEFEWCIDNEKLWVVQARSLAGKISAYKTWSDNSTSEQLAGVISPLTYDLAAHNIGSCTKFLLNKVKANTRSIRDTGILYQINSRVYMSLSEWSHYVCTAASSGLGHKKIRLAIGAGDAPIRSLNRLHSSTLTFKLWLWVLCSFAFAHIRAKNIIYKANSLRKDTNEDPVKRYEKLLVLLNGKVSWLTATDLTQSIAALTGSVKSAWIPSSQGSHRLLDGLRLEGPVVGDSSTLPSLTKHQVKVKLKDRIATRASHQHEHMGWARAEIFAAIRHVVLEIANVNNFLKDPQDIFLLTSSEILTLAKNNELPSDMPSRRKRMDNDKLHPLPHNFSTDGLPTHTIVSPVEPPPLSENSSWYGTGCQIGTVTAQAVSFKLGDSFVACAGKIAVVDRLTPDLMMQLRNASGIVVEKGSSLSHAVLIARELGIPTIVAVEGIQEQIKTGEHVFLDGGEGIVMRISK